MTELDVRPAERSELDAIEAAWPSHGVHAAHLRRQGIGEATYVVAWRGRTPVGSALLTWVGPMAPEHRAAHPDAVEIAHLQVREQHRGLGVGTALVRAAEDLALERGQTEVAMGVGLDNRRAAELYARLGYARTGVMATTTYTYRDQEGREQSASEEDELLVKHLSW